uniref:Tetraspanin n=1 Tax=Ciona intestinalis TaxID=7719 RepID=F6VJP0_CIOIN|nr:tetraspanin-18-like [Ciona intestinalis]|eukprot:XP_026693742.1 tetraspanin-18-like [Ciona intestinalis]
MRWVPANVNLIAVATSSVTCIYISHITLVAMATGCAAASLAVIGCCGAMSNSKYILGMFFMFLVVLFVLLLTLVGTGVWIRTQITEASTYELQSSFILSYYGDDGDNVESVAWKYIQRDLKCCGVSTVNGDQDYIGLDGGVKFKGGEVKGAKFWRIHPRTNFTSDHPAWPDSCCVQDEQMTYKNLQLCRYDSEAGEYRYTEGCRDKVSSFLGNNFLLISAMAATLAIIETIHFCVVRQLEAAMTTPDNVSRITQFSFEAPSSSSLNRLT